MVRSKEFFFLVEAHINFDVPSSFEALRSRSYLGRGNLELILVRVRFHGSEPVSFIRRHDISRENCVTAPLTQPVPFVTTTNRVRANGAARRLFGRRIGSRLRTALCKTRVIWMSVYRVTSL